MIMELNTWVSGINVIILLAIVYLYLQSFRKIRSDFTIGLILFAGLLLLQNLMTIYANLSMAAFFSAALLPYILAINIIQLAGLSVFLWLSLK